tara:strand:- start:311 stop:535 length:225 start_codon:yes stop_codon:yes gene_type:complete
LEQEEQPIIHLLITLDLGVMEVLQHFQQLHQQVVVLVIELAHKMVMLEDQEVEQEVILQYLPQLEQVEQETHLL